MLYALIGSTGTTIIGLLIFKAVQEEKNKVVNNRIKDLEDSMRTRDIDYVSVKKDLAVIQSNQNNMESKIDDFHSNFEKQQDKFANELSNLSKSLHELSGTLKALLPRINRND